MRHLPSAKRMMMRLLHNLEHRYAITGSLDYRHYSAAWRRTTVVVGARVRNKHQVGACRARLPCAMLKLPRQLGFLPTLILPTRQLSQSRDAACSERDWIARHEDLMERSRRRERTASPLISMYSECLGYRLRAARCTLPVTPNLQRP